MSEIKQVIELGHSIAEDFNDLVSGEKFESIKGVENYLNLVEESDDTVVACVGINGGIKVTATLAHEGIGVTFEFFSLISLGERYIRMQSFHFKGVTLK